MLNKHSSKAFIYFIFLISQAFQPNEIIINNNGGINSKNKNRYKLSAK